MAVLLFQKSSVSHQCLFLIIDRLHSEDLIPTTEVGMKLSVAPLISNPRKLNQRNSFFPSLRPLFKWLALEAEE